MASAGEKRFLEEYSAALGDDQAAVFVGAGVSQAAGYPSWRSLLGEIGDELSVSSKDVHDLAALAQWSIQESGSRNRVRDVIRREISPDRPLTATNRILARLPTRAYWTTNYDKLIERSFEEINRPFDVVASATDLSTRSSPGAARIFKMHGTIDRPSEVVISTDDYELFRKSRGAFLPLLQAHMTSMSMLFVGMSLTDPNVKQVLALIRESFSDNPPDHFALVKPPQASDFADRAGFESRHRQHELWARDLRRYGLTAVEVDDYAEIPKLLEALEREVARQRVWVSGSWPDENFGADGAKAYAVARGVGNAVGHLGLKLINGLGLVVGSAALTGFLEALQDAGSWDLDRRLITRPFPQPLGGADPDREQWAALRAELARLSGVAVFIGGKKASNGTMKVADGVLDEFEAAKKAGAFLLPIGATGGAAERIAKELVGSDLAPRGKAAQRPSNDDLRALADKSASISELVERSLGIIRKVTLGK